MHLSGQGVSPGRKASALLWYMNMAEANSVQIINPLQPIQTYASLSPVHTEKAVVADLLILV
jgi:hypothetical protein